MTDKLYKQLQVSQLEVSCFYSFSIDANFLLLAQSFQQEVLSKVCQQQ
jgi:hypothetical protein